LVLTAFVIIVARDRRARARVIGAAGVAVIAVAVVVPSVQGSGVVPLPQQAVSKFDFGLLAQQIESGTGSGGTRNSLSNQGLGLLLESRGLGVGAGNAEGRIRAQDTQIRVTNLHNWWLEVLVDLGVLGLALFAALWLMLVRGGMRAWSRGTGRATRWLGLASALALIGFIAGALGPSSAIHYGPMWITLGAAMAAMTLLDREVRA
jgi:O-antigen ligase